VPPSLHPTEKVKSYLTIVGISLSLIASIYAGVSVLWSKIGDVVTNEKLIDHNLHKDAHPPLREAQNDIEDKADMALRKVEELHTDQVMMMARLIRLVAADVERDPRRKSQKASIAEQAFRRGVLRGDGLEEAFLTALEESRVANY